MVDFTFEPGKLAPVGRYLCTVTRCEERESTNKNPMWVLDLEPLQGPVVGPDYDITDFIVFKSTVLDKTRRQLRALGYDIGHPNTAFRFNADPASAVGRKIWVDVTHREQNNGEIVASVTKTERYDGGSPQPMETPGSDSGTPGQPDSQHEPDRGEWGNPYGDETNIPF